jgi:ectoine hydroxylase-related dioxygenase (phytanoyl-CoA dioxygenase family)
MSAALRERGYCALPPLVDAATLAALRADLDGLHLRDPATNAYGILRHNLWRELPAFRALLLGGALAEVARSLLGAREVVFFQDNLIWKPPGTSARLEWHQDFAYWPLDRPDGLTLWLALDDADEANGCLRYVPGTHLLGERAATDFVAGAGQPVSADLPPLDAAGCEGEAAPVRAGEALAHHPLTWHMSGPNSTPRPRRAWSLTWLSPEVRWAPAHAPHPYNYFLAPTDGAPVCGEAFPRFAARALE